MDTTNTNQALSRAIAMWPSLKAFATDMGVPYQTVQQWLRNGVPAAYCPKIEKLTAGKVMCEELNQTVDWAYLRGTIRQSESENCHPQTTVTTPAKEAA